MTSRAEQSVNVGKYSIDSVFSRNTQPCPSSKLDPGLFCQLQHKIEFKNKNVNDVSDLVHVDSYLKGLAAPTERLYNRDRQVVDLDQLFKNENENVDFESTTGTSFLNFGEPTRERRECNTLSGVTIDRFENHLPVNPQNMAQYQDRLYYFGKDTRMLAKENL